MSSPDATSNRSGSDLGLSSPGCIPSKTPNMVNVLHSTKVQDALELILAHDVFNGIVKTDSLSVQEGSSVAPLCLDSSVEGPKASRGSVNAFWFCIKYSPITGLPVNRASVNKIMSTKFIDPNIMEFMVPLSSGCSATTFQERGCMRNVGSKEVFHAMILAIARDITQHKSSLVLRKWRQTVLSCIGHAVVIPEQSIFFRAMKERQLALDLYGAFRLSVVPLPSLKKRVLFVMFTIHNS